MAWQMATLDARRNSPKDIYFPIPEDVTNPDRRRNYEKALKLFPDEVAREIDAVQPHNGSGSPKDHPLWQLNKLCNLDKHMLIPIHSRGINLFVPNVPGTNVENFDHEDAIEVSVPEQFESELNLDSGSPDEIEIGEWNSDWRIPRHRLSDIHGFITCTVVPRFESFNLAALPDESLRVYKVIPVY
jgi:hypothetical protein